MNPADGGPCQGIRNAIPSLEQQGVHNEVLCLDDPQASFLKNDRFIIHAVGPASNPWRYSKKLFLWLAENLTRYDVVIVHGLWLYPSYAAMKAIRRLRGIARNGKLREDQKMPRIYFMPHGMLDPYFQKAPDRKFKAMRNWIYYKLIESKVVHEADGLLFTCEEELRLARLAFRPYHPKNEINIGYGVAEPPVYTDRMREAFIKQCPQLIDCSYLVFLGRIHQKKGVDLLVEGYRRLLKLQANTSFSAENESVKHNKLPFLVIAGPGLETEYGLELQRVVNEIPGLKHFVVFPGMLTGSAKWGALFGCEAFILPSHQENFGIAVVEAMACSKPVLISDKVNIWQEIKSEEAGMIAEDSAEGVDDLFRNWLSLSDLKKSDMSKNARRCYEDKFATKQATLKFLQELA